MGVSVDVLNNSARTVTPKFYLCEKQTFVAQSKRIVHTNDILFATGDSVPAGTSQTVTRVLSIPPQLSPTFFNCSTMKLEYRVKVLTLCTYTYIVNYNQHVLIHISLPDSINEFYPDLIWYFFFTLSVNLRHTVYLCYLPWTNESWCKVRNSWWLHGDWKISLMHSTTQWLYEVYKDRERKREGRSYTREPSLLIHTLMKRHVGNSVILHPNLSVLLSARKGLS